MAPPRRIRFNPNDYFFYSHDRMMRRQGGGANIAFMSMDLDGRIDPPNLASAVRATFAAHPVLLAGIRISLPMGRPYWRIPSNIGEAATSQAAIAVTHDDFSDHANGAADAEALWQSRCGPKWDLRTGPQMRVELYSLPENKSRICIRWPHLLMDAEGALLFLAELAQRSRNDISEINTDGLHSDELLVDPLKGCGFLSRVRLAVAGLRGMTGDKSLEVHTLFEKGRPVYQDQRCLHRAWTGERFATMCALAKACVPPGPAPYARYLAVCIVRALHRIFTEQGVETDAYLITLPHSISAAPGDATHTRPLQGNYIVSPTLCGPKSLIHDKKAMASELTRQLVAYSESDMQRKQWAISWAANFSRAGFYQLLMRLPLGLEALSSGFSYYGGIRAPIDAICGARVTNLWGAGPLPTPPAWNPVFARFGDTLNMSLTYSRPAISDELATKYLRYIDEAMFDD
ncbi:MAG: hypothetical protein H6819_01255 [Phycisphaerales bacterium]|nr:hypothetical protein [Phycisphaerales bacterium]MCB9857165.1 hypothetical protein [Phycisphaerales bacterium]